MLTIALATNVAAVIRSSLLLEKKNVYRVQPDARDEALRVGWVQIGTE